MAYSGALPDRLGNILGQPSRAAPAGTKTGLKIANKDALLGPLFPCEGCMVPDRSPFQTVLMQEQTKGKRGDPVRPGFSLSRFA